MTNDHKDDTSGLKSLGNKEVKYQYNQPNISMLETFPNQYPQNPYIISFECGEFTSLCPRTGQPDFANVSICYVPNKVCLETKSLKLYIFAFRNHGSFMETITNKIFEDILQKIEPAHLRVEAEFNVRGGIGPKIVCDSSYIFPAKMGDKFVEEENITEATRNYIKDILENGENNVL